jgi:hypothetical protein
VDTGSRKENASNKPTQVMKLDQSPRIFSAALTMLIEGLAAQKVPNFLALATNTSVSMIASSESPCTSRRSRSAPARFQGNVVNKT